MTAELEKIGLDAVDKFITTWNSRDPVAWAGSLNFPHVRPAPRGPILVAADADEYISRVDFDKVVASGWDHSEWDYKQVLHTSATKIHVVGQWSRYNANGEKILTNPVVYIVTRDDTGWGVQSRFSADFPGDEDTSGMEARSFKLIETWALHITNGYREAASELINYPFFAINVGALDETPDASGYAPTFSSITIDSMMSVQSGLRSINVAAELKVDDKPMQAVINVTLRDDHLGIQAISLLDPADRDQS